MMKFLLIVLFSVVTLAPSALAAGSGFVPLAPIPGLTDSISPTSVVDSTTLANFFNNLYKYIIGLAAALAVIMLIWGGLEYSTQDSVSSKEQGKQRMTEAILGLVLVLAPVLVFSIINPNILNLSLNLPPIDLRTGPTTTGGGTSPGGTDPASGCSVTPSTSNILQFATCPTSAAAQTWGQGCNNGAILSTVEVLTRNADGTPASVLLSCTRRNIFMFIDLHTTTLVYSINDLQPLATVSNTVWGGANTLYETNAADAIQYASICNSVGRATCVNRSPAISWADSCVPLPTTPLPASAPSPAKCYKETLSCEDKGPVASAITGLCSRSPSWSPFR